MSDMELHPQSTEIDVLLDIEASKVTWNSPPPQKNVRFDS